MIQNFFQALVAAAKNFAKQDGLRLSAALSFYSAFSIAPLLLVIIGLAGAFYGEDAVSGLLYQKFRSFMGDGTAKFIQEILASSRKPADNMLMTLLGAVLLMIGAVGVFAQLQAALNEVWNVKPATSVGIRGFIKNRLLSFSMVLIAGFLLLISMITATVLQTVGRFFDQISAIPVAAWNHLSSIASGIIVTVLFAAIFKVLPDLNLQWRSVIPGAIFTTVLFTIGKYAISWYLSFQAVGSTFGSAASLVVILSWLYYTSIILIFGAEFTRAFAEQSGRAVKES